MKRLFWLILLLVCALCVTACSNDKSTASTSAAPDTVQEPQKKEGTPGLIYEPKVGGYVVAGYNGISADIVIPDTYADGPVIEVKELALQDVDITGLTTGKNLKRIEKYAFSLCKFLTKIELNEGLEYLNGFSDNYSLKEITVPSTVTTIGDLAFFRSNLLEKVEFVKGSQLHKIDVSAFNNCASLKSINLTDTNVEIIEKGAFENCFGLKELHLPASCIYMGRGAFRGWTSDQTIYIGCPKENLVMYESGYTVSKGDPGWETGVELIFGECEAKIVYP